MTLFANNDFDLLTSSDLVKVIQNLLDRSLDYVQPFQEISQIFDQ